MCVCVCVCVFPVVGIYFSSTLATSSHFLAGNNGKCVCMIMIM